MSKDFIIARINALLAKTTAAGCTEAEAALAMHKAQELMMAHAIEQGELGIRAEKCEIASIARRDKLDGLLFALAAWCGCKTYYNTGRNLVYFFGMPADLQIAQYMYGYLSAVLDAEAAEYRKTEAYAELRQRGISGISIGSTFRLGLVARLAERLRDMTKTQAAQEQAATGNTGTALVVVKNQVVNDQYATYLASQGIRLRTAKSRATSLSSRDAYNAGRAAGDGISLTRGGIGGGQRAIAAR